MYVIGITGGVGAGKSTVLEILKEECNCVIYKADDISNELKLKGQPCYEKVVDILGEEVLDADGEINRRMMAITIFADELKKKAVEKVIHPAVKRYVLDKIDECRREGVVDYFFIEAALLIEDGYQNICDEIWYVYASVANRTKRLMSSRNYSIHGVEKIMDSQMSDAEFRKKCECIIDNDGDETVTRDSIRRILGK